MDEKEIVQAEVESTPVEVVEVVEETAAEPPEGGSPHPSPTELVTPSPTGEGFTPGEIIEEIVAPLLPRAKRQAQTDSAEEPPTANGLRERPQAPSKRATERSEALSESVPAASPARDFKKEYETLIAIHPEVADGKIPDEVFKQAATEGTNLLNVYEAKLIADQRKELDELRKEIAALKQNGEAFRHAPVTGSGFAPTGKTDPYALAWERA